jgi:uncharacterized protein YjbI with pentapeptide repeats
VLLRLDGNRKALVVHFLRESGLINKHRSVVDLLGADLRAAKLRGSNLSEADLRGADLSGADLRSVHLSGALLNEANLRFADLGHADLSGADLSGADLSGADLNNAQGITNEELEQQAYYLEGTTMPDGQKYEDWRKNIGREEAGENSGP